MQLTQHSLNCVCPLICNFFPNKYNTLEFLIHDFIQLLKQYFILGWKSVDMTMHFSASFYIMHPWVLLSAQDWGRGSGTNPPWYRGPNIVKLYVNFQLIRDLHLRFLSVLFKGQLYFCLVRRRKDGCSQTPSWHLQQLPGGSESASFPLGNHVLGTQAWAPGTVPLLFNLCTKRWCHTAR